MVKDPLKTKGARLSMNVSIAGRYLVFAPQGSGVGVSRRLADKERDRLRKMVDRTYKGPGGLIVRTAAHGAKKPDFVREISYLQKLNEVLERRARTRPRRRRWSSRRPTSRSASSVTSSSASSKRRSSTRAKQFERVTNFFQRTAPELVDGVELYKGKKPLFEKWKIDEEIESTLNRRVDLPSGGYLIIDYAEALTVIDVNSGCFTGRGKGGLEETITKVNTEAADEAVRQLRLRDIGGIIVIDFIDMARASNRDKVLKTMRKALDADKSKSYVVEVSPLGLVEMTRQNVTDGVREILTAPCPTCAWRGRRALGRDGGAGGVAEDARHRRRRKRGRGVPGPGQPEGRPRADRSRQRPGRARGGDRQAVPLRGRRRAARSTPSKWSSPGSREEIEERALPFKVGEEVLVKIDEPHMYNADDAVARIDSYIVSVTGGGPFVGERKLVRIDEVERSAAIASLLGGESPERRQRADGEENGSELESDAPSRKRSRGRRGGRGRSRAKQGSKEDE